MQALCIIVTGTDLTQISVSFKSELVLMSAYSDWASVYTLIRKSRAVIKLRTIIGPRLEIEPRTSHIGSRRASTAPLTATLLGIYFLKRTLLKDD